MKETNMDNFIVMGTDMTDNNDIGITNCPNCGGVLHDCICDYCGTIISNDIRNFIGKTSLLISIDDDDNIIFSAIDVRTISEENYYDTYYTDNCMYHEFVSDVNIDISGSLTNNPTSMHVLRKLRDILKGRLNDF